MSSNKILASLKNNNILDAFKLSCSIGNYNLAKYLLLIRYDIPNTIDINFVNILIDKKGNDITNIDNCFIFASFNGYLYILQNIYKLKQNFDYEFAFCCACLNGHIDVINWLLSLKIYININAYVGAAFNLACLNGHLNIIKKITNIYPSFYKIYYDEPFHLACSNGHFYVVKWLLNNNNNNIYINEYYFLNACKRGFIKIAKLLYFINPNIHINSRIFMIACSYGQIHIMKWLLSINSNIINNIDSYEYLFMIGCRKGYINCLKYLLLINPNINISYNNELPFKIACLNNQKSIVEWLLSIKPEINISINNDYIFKTICNKNIIRIVRLFCKINPIKYYVKIINNKIIKYRIIIYKTINEIKNCAICYDNLSQIITLCNHQYCKECLDIWLEDNDSCPYCRSNINDYFLIN